MTRPSTNRITPGSPLAAVLAAPPGATKPTPGDTLGAAATNALTGSILAALLARSGGMLARRAHRTLGTPYVPLSRKDAFLLAASARAVITLLKPVQGTTAQRYAQRRAEATRQLRLKAAQRGLAEAAERLTAKQPPVRVPVEDDVLDTPAPRP